MLFLSKGLYGPRPPFHFDAYQSQPGWWFIEVCCWTLEIDLHRNPFRRSKP